MEQRLAAFNDFWEQWKLYNMRSIEDPELLSREVLAHAALSAGWNAALEHVKKMLDR